MRVPDPNILAIPTDPLERRKVDWIGGGLEPGVRCAVPMIPGSVGYGLVKGSANFGLVLPDCARSYCSAAIAPQPIAGREKKASQINELDGYDAILTWLDAVSMVRAAFEGDGASFPSTQHRFGSPQHG
jgi:hypothetical protein